MELQVIQQKIYEVRGYRVMFDFDIASLYQVETKVLKRAVKRNIDKFPSDFMFELTPEEFENLRCQFGTSSWGGTRYMPYVFTQEGIASLSGVLRSNVATQVNISIMRAFIAMRQMIMGYEELIKRIEELEVSTNTQFSEIYEALTLLASKRAIDEKPHNPIGYRIYNEEK